MVAEEHARLWAILIGPPHLKSGLMFEVIPAERIEKEEGHVSKYIYPKDTIQIVAATESLDDDYLCAGREAVWRTELLHELAHEHQTKHASKESEEGNALMKVAHLRFPGPNHGPDFYTAICDCAKRLPPEWTPERLLRSI